MTIYYKIHKDDESAKNLLDSSIRYLITSDCFSEYPCYYGGDDSDGNLYIGFFAHPNITKLVDEINTNFKNIKVTIIGMREFKWPSYDSTFFGGELTVIFYGNYNYCLFKVQLNDKYSDESKFILTLTIAEFIRVYCPAYTCFMKMENINENFIDSALKAHNTSDYGAWICHDPSRNYYCSRDTFNKLDDIELINNITDGRVSYENLPFIHGLIRVLDGSQPIEYMCEAGYYV